MKDRITRFLTKENISPAEFADKIGVQRSSVSHVLNGRNYPSASFIQKMLMVYPQLNPRWLLLGDGEMTMTTVQSIPAPSLFDFSSSKEVEIKPAAPISVEDMNDLATAPDSSIGKQNVSQKQPDKPSIEVVESQVKETIEKSAVTTEVREREIDKIIILYKDKTFTSYSPS